jgi:hypothetical protein
MIGPYFTPGVVLALPGGAAILLLVLPALGPAYGAGAVFWQAARSPPSEFY